MRSASFLLLLPLLGCEAVTGSFEVSEIVGYWEGQSFGSFVFSFTFTGDHKGTGIIPVETDQGYAPANFFAEWELRDEDVEDEFRLDLECSEAVCHQFLTEQQRTFPLDCETKNDAEKLVCVSPQDPMGQSVTLNRIRK